MLWKINYLGISILFVLFTLAVCTNDCTGQATPPVIDTPIYSSVTAQTVILGATIESDGGAHITDSGIVYGTTFDPDTTSSKMTNGATGGAFTVDVTGLIPYTTYHFRGYAVNAQGTSYTEDATFTTPIGAFYGWQAHDISGPGSWGAIASSSDGTRVVSVLGSYLVTSVDSGATWTRRTTAGWRVWAAVASSSDGMKLAAAATGFSEEEYTQTNDYIYTSADGGATWIQRTSAGKRIWTSIVSSSDGTRLAATEDTSMDGYIYLSDDSGTTWTQLTSLGSQCWSIAMSSDGMKLVAASQYTQYLESLPGYVYTSADFGATWTRRTSAGKRYWGAVASSSGGTKLAAVGTWKPSYIYTSRDSGATWSPAVNAGHRIWQTVLSSADGTRLIALAEDGSLYFSTDSGAAWRRGTRVGNPSWSNIASSSDGTKLVAVGDNLDKSGNFLGAYVYTSGDSGATWIQRTTPGTYSWVSTASSSDGTQLVASTGCIYTSGDSGTTWNRQASPDLKSVASSSDGAKLIALGSGYIYASNDYGATWTQLTSAGMRTWEAAACSADGTKLVAVDYGGCNGGYIYTSNDSGATWTEQTGAGSLMWQGVASSADGTKLVAFETYYNSGGHIYTSSDSGVTWTQRTAAGQRNWRAIASSANGSILVAAEHSEDGGYSIGGYIYTSSDSGATWTQHVRPGAGFWVSAASSSDGTKLIVADNGGLEGGYIFASADSGATWSQQTSLGKQCWGAVALSADGSKAVAVSDIIYTGVALTFPWIDSPTAGSVTTTSATLGAAIESDGSAPITAAGFAYGLDANPDITGNTAGSGAIFGPFTTEVSGLTSNTLYHFRGYVTSSDGTSYTDDGAFTTLADAPTAVAATQISTTGFIANWTAPSGTAPIFYNLDVSTDPGFSSFVAGYKDLSVSGTSTAVTGLTPEATYYYRVRALNAGGASDSSDAVEVATPSVH